MVATGTFKSGNYDSPIVEQARIDKAAKKLEIQEFKNMVAKYMPSPESLIYFYGGDAEIVQTEFVLRLLDLYKDKFDPPTLYVSED